MFIIIFNLLHDRCQNFGYLFSQQDNIFCQVPNERSGIYFLKILVEIIDLMLYINMYTELGTKY